MPPPPPKAPTGWRTGPPDFVGVGFQRCGTTRWYNLITAHTEVARPVATKELHFFDRFHSGGFGEADRERLSRVLPPPAGEGRRVDSAVCECALDPAAARPRGSGGETADDRPGPRRAAHVGPGPRRRGGGTAGHAAQPPRSARGVRARPVPPRALGAAPPLRPLAAAGAPVRALRGPARAGAAAHVRLPRRARGRADHGPGGPPPPARRKAAPGPGDAGGLRRGLQRGRAAAGAGSRRWTSRCGPTSPTSPAGASGRLP